MPGRIYTLEGIDGSGKTTVLKELQRRQLKGAIFTREPYRDDNIGYLTTQCIMDPNVDSRTELLLFLANREHHYDKVIKPAIESGVDVIIDRHIDSTLVYQQKALSYSDLLYVTHLFQRQLPTKTFLLDGKPDILMKRIKKENKFDEMSLSYFEELRQKYLELAKKFSHRFVVIDVVENDLNTIVEIILKEMNV